MIAINCVDDNSFLNRLQTLDMPVPPIPHYNDRFYFRPIVDFADFEDEESGKVEVSTTSPWGKMLVGAPFNLVSNLAFVFVPVYLSVPYSCL